MSRTIPGPLAGRRRNGSDSLANERPQRTKPLPLKPSHRRSAACPWLRSNGKGQQRSYNSKGWFRLELVSPSLFEADRFGENRGGVVEVGQPGGQGRDGQVMRQCLGELQPGQCLVVNLR